MGARLSRVRIPDGERDQRFDADGSNQTTFASGLRNATALAFQPGTGDLYAVVQERDGLGDRVPPDFLARVDKGAFYGWPYAYTGQHPQPGFAQLRTGEGQGIEDARPAF
jgi:glucose/arabinose dehydrogenase